MTAGRKAALLAGAALVASLAACTSSGTPGTGGTTATAPVTGPASVTQPLTSDPPAPSSTASTPSSSKPAPSTPATSAAPRSTCTSVSVRVIRGSASLGQEIAALQFTNDGTQACVLVGFPAVTMLRKGQQLGNPSQPSSVGAVSKRTLAPGDIAESVLHDYTQTCNAALSDSLRVQVPGSDTTVIRPAELRGCILRVDKLGPPQ